MSNEHRIERTSRDDDAPIPLADDPSPPASPRSAPAVARGPGPAVPPGATAPRPRLGPPINCPNCRYDVRNLNGVTCPECGIKLAPALRRAERELEARKSLRPLLTRAIVAVLVSWAIIAGVLALEQAIGVFPYYLLSYAITIPIGLAVFYGLAMMWFGFDQPFKLLILQLLAIYAISDATRMVVGSFTFSLIGWIAGAITYLTLLCRWLDLEWPEALAVAVVTAVTKFFIMMMLFSLLG